MTSVLSRNFSHIIFLDSKPDHMSWTDSSACFLCFSVLQTPGNEEYINRTHILNIYVCVNSPPVHSIDNCCASSNVGDTTVGKLDESIKHNNSFKLTAEN